MKATELRIPGLGAEGLVQIHHEDDWSGLATISWFEGSVEHRVTLPVIIIEQLSHRIQRSKTTRSRHARRR